MVSLNIWHDAVQQHEKSLEREPRPSTYNGNACVTTKIRPGSHNSFEYDPGTSRLARWKVKPKHIRSSMQRSCIIYEVHRIIKNIDVKKNGQIFCSQGENILNINYNVLIPFNNLIKSIG